MKPVARNTFFAAALAFAFGGPALAAAEHDHDQGHGVQEASLELHQGQKWATDEALRQGMENIRAALYANMQIFHGADEASIDYGALAAAVNGEVGKEPGVARRTGAERIAEALGEYARQFDHPGWF